MTKHIRSEYTANTGMAQQRIQQQQQTQQQGWTVGKNFFTPLPKRK